MGRPSLGAAGAAALCLLLGAPAAAQEPGEALRLGGSIRTLAAGSLNYDNRTLFGDHRADAVSQTVLRLIVSGRPAGSLTYEVHAVQTATLETFSAQDDDGLWSSLASGPSRRWTAADLSWEWAEGADGRAGLLLDRANATLELPGADLTVGRQAISFGPAWFWNPLDVFLPVDPRTIHRDYRAGVDAARLDVSLGALAGLTVAAVAGRQGRDGGVSWSSSSLLARVSGAGRAWDAAFQAGKIPGGYLVGGSLARETAGFLIRGEVARTHGDRSLPEPADDHWAAVASLHRRVGARVSVEAEYFYNGAGDPDNPAAGLVRVLDGTSPQMSRQLAGVVAWHEISPLVKATTAWMHSLSDDSDLFHLGLTVSISDETDLRIGAVAPSGPRPDGLVARSEFGSYPGLVYLELKRCF